MTDRLRSRGREEGHYPISSMCRWSRVSKPGYYSWRDRPQSQTAIRREELAILIKDVFEDSDGTSTGTDGFRWSWSGAVCGPTGPRSAPSCVSWGYRPRNHEQKSEPPCRLRTWMSGRTCSGGTSPLTSPARSCVGTSPMSGRGLGLSILRPFWTADTLKVVGYAMGDRMRTSLVCQAIDMAVRRCPVERGVTVFHSDRGSQYTSQRFLDHLNSYGIRPSVGRTGACWDNAWAESFNATLKNERVHRMVYPTKDKAVSDIASWIELRYNHVRLHPALGYRTPNEVERELLNLTKAA